MEKLLIVDDEHLVREGLCETVDWAALGLEVIGTAENGAAGLEAARRLKPDLIISDVRMPVSDGLEMAKKLFDEGADLAVIVYSGYKDFEYARRALESNVAGFLLKPIENEELINKVKEVLGRLHAQRRESKLLGQVQKNVPIFKKRLISSLTAGADTFEAVHDQLMVLGIDCPPRGLLIYIRSKSGVPEELISCFEGEFADSAFISESFEDYSIIFTGFADEVKAARKAVKVLDASLKRGKERYCVSIVPFDCNVKEAFARAEALAKGAPFTAVNTVVTGTNGGGYKKLVRDAIAIIEKDYDKKLSVKGVAEMLYTSESHLMHEFKEQTGKTFNGCLTDFRMLKAEEMLLSGVLRVNEVAFAVGYTDVKYFGQVFKEYHGITPSEFVKKRVDEDQGA